MRYGVFIPQSENIVKLVREAGAEYTWPKTEHKDRVYSVEIHNPSDLLKAHDRVDKRSISISAFHSSDSLKIANAISPLPQSICPDRGGSGKLP
jgi:hypothetical protein